MITAHDLTPAVTPAGQAAMAAALAGFGRRYPAYAGTAVLDDMRAGDYTRLDAAGHVYLDYTGGGLYADSQLTRHRGLLARAVFGNPHSQNLPSREATAQVEATRAQILEFFRASPEEYEVIFTPNATGALRLVGESYPFGPGSRLLLTFDNHNSVNGIRQFARARGASVSYVPLTPADLRVSQEPLARHLGAATSARRLARRRSGSAARNLFAFPAQSNFSGVQHPLAWIARAPAGLRLGPSGHLGSGGCQNRPLTALSPHPGPGHESAKHESGGTRSHPMGPDARPPQSFMTRRRRHVAGAYPSV